MSLFWINSNLFHVITGLFACFSFLFMHLVLFSHLAYIQKWSFLIVLTGLQMEFVPPLPPPLPPEIPTGSSHETPPLPRQSNEFPQEVEMDVSSEEESELESEDDEESQRFDHVILNFFTFLCNSPSLVRPHVHRHDRTMR